MMHRVPNQNPEILSEVESVNVEVDEPRNDRSPSNEDVADDQCEILDFETLNTASMSEEDLLRVAQYDDSVFQHALLILDFLTYKTRYATIEGVMYLKNCKTSSFNVVRRLFGCEQLDLCKKDTMCVILHTSIRKSV